MHNLIQDAKHPCYYPCPSLTYGARFKETARKTRRTLKPRPTGDHRDHADAPAVEEPERRAVDSVAERGRDASRGYPLQGRPSEPCCMKCVMFCMNYTRDVIHAKHRVSGAGGQGPEIVDVLHELQSENL